MLFNATVEPISQYLQTIQEVYGEDTYIEISEKFDVFKEHLFDIWSARTKIIEKFMSESDGGLQANIMIDKFGLLQDLRSFVKKLRDRLIEEAGAPETIFMHLLNQGDADGIYLPFKFKKPIQLKIPGRAYPMPIGSSVMLEKELEIINKHLKIEKTFKTPVLPEFIEASSREIDKFETEYVIDPSFWIKFGFVVLRTLNNKARDAKMPIVFHDGT
ncbi:MAG: hypothetical protein K8S87_02500 [Planctomycetes bacterium]|nr:hypothetical protein [Planctomycetota bacterium]